MEPPQNCARSAANIALTQEGREEASALAQSIAPAFLEDRSLPLCACSPLEPPPFVSTISRGEKERTITKSSFC